jgi:hypothetical protein
VARRTTLVAVLIRPAIVALAAVTIVNSPMAHLSAQNVETLGRSGEPKARASAAKTPGDPDQSLTQQDCAGARCLAEMLVVVSDPKELAPALAKVESGGGHVLTTQDHRIAWTTLTDRNIIHDLREMGVRVAADAEEAEELAAVEIDSTVAAVARSFAKSSGVGREAFSGRDPAHPLIDDAWEAGPVSPREYLDNVGQAGLDPSNALVLNLLRGRGGNSDDMIGTVTVAVMFVESDGTIDPDTYTWSTSHEDETLSDISYGLRWWAARSLEHEASVSFNVIAYRHTDARIQQGYEPVSRPYTDAPLWVSAIMADFGYTSGDHLARVTAFDTWLRSDQGTDCAYTAFVCYNPSPAPSQYTDGHAAWAYLGGPYTSLLYRSFNSPFNQVFTHETGHIFQACDEYYQAGYGGCSSCDVCSHGVNNGNCEYCNPASVDCMMKNNTWTLCSYTPGHLGWSTRFTWIPRTTSIYPTPRAAPMVYDSVRGVCVLHGGGAGGGSIGETWEWDGCAWCLRDTGGPSPRQLHAMAFDAARGVTVLFGGRRTVFPYDEYNNETWEWDGYAWSLRSIDGPSPREAHAMAFDAACAVTVLYGGGVYSWETSNYEVFGDTWEWDGVQWTLRSTGVIPPLRAHAMAYDASRTATVLFGGVDEDWVLRGETWEWNRNGWLLQSTSGPSPLGGSGMAYDATRQMTLLFGGSSAGGLEGDTWGWKDGVWMHIAAGGPSPRYLPAFAYDESRAVAVLFGGGDNYQGLGDTWEYGHLMPGDINRDGSVSLEDCELFVAVLLGGDTDPYHMAAADMNGSGSVDGRDMQAFVGMVLGG